MGSASVVESGNENAGGEVSVKANGGVGANGKENAVGEKGGFEIDRDALEVFGIDRAGEKVFLIYLGVVQAIETGALPVNETFLLVFSVGAKLNISLGFAAAGLSLVRKNKEGLVTAEQPSLITCQ